MHTRISFARCTPIHLCAALLLSCLAPISSQALMSVSFDGVVTSSFVFTDPFGFGTGDGVLNGKPIAGSFFYSPALAPPDTDIATKSVKHRTSQDSEAWFSTPEIFIDGQLVPIPRFDLSSLVSSSDTALIGLADEVLFGGPTADVAEYSRERFQFQDINNIHSFEFDLSVDSLASGANFIDSLLLTTPYSVNDFSMLATSASNLSSRQMDDGVESFSILLNFELTPNTLSVVLVPEPSTSLLLGLGLVVLAVRGNRERSSRGFRKKRIPSPMKMARFARSASIRSH
jgi:hypothetical protein